MQFATSVPLYPGLHWHVLPGTRVPDPAGQGLQSDSEVAPGEAAYLPSGHSLHSAAPSESMYLPRAQARQSSKVGPAKPLAQRQRALPRVDDVLGGHGSQVVDALALDQVPEKHRRQAVASPVLSYRPGGQATHDTPSCRMSVASQVPLR